jgi:hypothetical protein
LWCFAFETKNRQVKQYTNVCFQRKNISLSLAYKSQMRFSNFLIKYKNGFPNELKILKFKNETLQNFLKKDYFTFVASSFDNYHHLKICYEIIYKNTHYKTGYIIFVENLIYEIVEMIIHDANCYFVTKNIMFEKFCTHTLSYIISQKTNNFQIINIDKINSLPVTAHTLPNGKSFIRKGII